MAGSFVFGVASHFFVPGPDNIFTQHPGAWLAAFQASTVLTVLLAGIGCVVGVWTVKRLSRSPGEAPVSTGSSEARIEPR